MITMTKRAVTVIALKRQAFDRLLPEGSSRGPAARLLKFPADLSDIEYREARGNL